MFCHGVIGATWNKMKWNKTKPNKTKAKPNKTQNKTTQNKTQRKEMGQSGENPTGYKTELVIVGHI